MPLKRFITFPRRRRRRRKVVGGRRCRRGKRQQQDQLAWSRRHRLPLRQRHCETLRCECQSIGGGGCITRPLILPRPSARRQRRERLAIVLARLWVAQPLADAMGEKLTSLANFSASAVGTGGTMDESGAAVREGRMSYSATSFPQFFATS